jgi:putative ABC transport system permease protein
VVGVTAAYAIVQNLSMTSGAFITTGQVRGVEPVVVLGASLARKLFGTGAALGQTVRVNGQPLRVVGVLAPKGGGGFGSVDDRAFVPLPVAQQRLFGGRTPDGNGWLVSSIGLAARDAAQLPAIQEQTARLLRERHRLPADGRGDDFNFFSQDALLNTLSTVTTLFTIFLAAVAGISLLVGGIGIMNIMLVSVTERTREIGLRKALGGREADILTQFLIEALVISVTGGLIGLALGVGLSLAVTLTGLLTTTISAGSVILAIGFALAVGLFFGIAPARQAARLNPIDALRHE